jgi:hypothetical protein
VSRVGACHGHGPGVGTGRSQNMATIGSIRGLTRWRKFETCPMWGPPFVYSHFWILVYEFVYGRLFNIQTALVLSLFKVSSTALIPYQPGAWNRRRYRGSAAALPNKRFWNRASRKKSAPANPASRAGAVKAGEPLRSLSRTDRTTDIARPRYFRAGCHTPTTANET